MNKAEFIAKISDATDVNKKDIKAVINALPDVIKEAVASDDNVSLVGFATFSKKHVDAKTGTIHLGSKKGEKWETSAKDVVTVKLSDSYRLI